MIRELQSEHVERLVVIPGIIVQVIPLSQQLLISLVPAQASIKVHKAFKLRIRCKKLVAVWYLLKPFIIVFYRCGHSRTLDLKPTSRSKTAIPRR